ncbi:hypothetical protein AOCH_004106 [Aspergillus ochraceoroseus]|uniref:PH domain-containing protein n=1 Tax=Aspergillus ochraceoroseus TaxID=138278 RepID=A0A0F8UE04_9EURO|nr:hypothetical protein AOCH_004106 [Aspergillus ochraceoroseus]
MSTGQRPLSEVSPMAQRRNSPSWSQSTRTMKNAESSPYDSASSTRLFWQGRESSPFQKSSENQAPYDPGASFSPRKRPSLENLKRASRVKNSSMFRDYQEYDPASVYVPQRPLATGRSSPQRQAQGITSPRSSNIQDGSQIGSRPPSPSKDQVPPAKSSLSRASRYGTSNAFDPENEIWSDIDGTRYTKSVTFDAAPPQVNEYEMTTPDPSSVASESRDGSYDSEEDECDISFDMESSLDRDDSFDASLEDLEKTPVVLPEDWRYMSSDTVNGEGAKEDEHSFISDGSCSPEPTQEPQRRHSRVESQDSDSERRPLPPLPAINGLSFSARTPSPDKLSAAFELGSGSQRVLPSPPAPASYSKSDIAELGQSSMSLEDRLRLMMIAEREHDDTRTLEKDGGEELNLPQDKDESIAETQAEEKDSLDSRTPSQPTGDGSDAFSPPRISRDSILRDIRKSESYLDDSYEHSSQGSESPHDYMHYDPDVPIPSLEHDNDNEYEDDDDDTNSVVIKEEHEDDHDNLYDIPDFYENIPSNDSSFKNLTGSHDDDDGPQYASHSIEKAPRTSNSSFGSEATPVPGDKPAALAAKPADNAPPEGSQHDEIELKMAAISESLRRPVTPENQEETPSPSTPDSVIRHPIDSDVSDLEMSADESIPDPIATIKAPGTGLKTRPSLTPADIESMAATRRKISGQYPPPTPALTTTNSEDAEDPTPGDQPESKSSKDTQRKSSFMKLDIPFSIQEDSLGFGLDKEFDRVIESQKVAFDLALSQLYSSMAPCPQSLDPPQDPAGVRQNPQPDANHRVPKQRGYLMRHNTKFIVASSHPEEEPAPASTTGEPLLTHVPRSPLVHHPVRQVNKPGLLSRGTGKPDEPVYARRPVQFSNAQEPPTPIEEVDPALNGAFEEGEERGRLFVKVVGMKYLDLPLPRGERSYFALTLDNGLHCVTTAWLELGKTAPIGQEFELIVQNDLEFQLTLQMKVDEDKFKVAEPTPSASPARPKQSTFSRVFASPRKRKELDMKQQLASQQQKKQDVNAPVWDRLRTLVARDGSFARAYVALSDHEKHAYGRPYTVDIACFNEWAVDEQPSSVKSKKSTSSALSQRRPPYKIGKLELQLLFVPKPKGAKDDDMPKSMNACIREMREAENASSRSWEGFLSQQGGDCPYWRRRFFKLQGSKLTAYHETTRQPRATINLSKAAKLIDDRSTLTQKETTTRGGKRRKSGFAEEEEGYMFVEEGFRIRFGNGEVIDFYADSAADKEGWMQVLAETVGKGTVGNSQVKPWTELVLKRERSTKSRRETTDRVANTGLAPPPPVKKDAPPTTPAPAPATNAAQQRPRHKHTQSQPEVRSPEARRQKARSLIF